MNSATDSSLATSTPAPEVSALRGRYAVAAMFLINGFLMGSWAPQIPFMLTRHAIDEFVTGLLILLIGLGAMIAMSWTGWLINRFGSRRVSTTFAFVACLAFAGMILTPTIAPLIPLLLVYGAAIGSMDVAMNANAVEVERRLGRAVMSSSHGFWSVGGFIGGGLGGWLIARVGVEGHALIAAGAALVTLLVAAPFLITEAHHQSDDTPKPRYVWPRGLAIYVLGAMALFSMFPEGAVLDWSALYLEKELSAGIATSGLAFAAFSGAMALMRFAGDGARNRYGAVATMRISGFVAAVGMVAGALAPDAWLAMAAFGIAGLGIANMVPIAFSAAGNQPGLSPGAGISLVTMIGYSGGLFAPTTIGFVAEHIGFRLVYAALAAALVLVATQAWRVASADRA